MSVKSRLMIHCRIWSLVLVCLFSSICDDVCIVYIHEFRVIHKHSKWRATETVYAEELQLSGGELNSEVFTLCQTQFKGSFTQTAAPSHWSGSPQTFRSDCCCCSAQFSRFQKPPAGGSLQDERQKHTHTFIQREHDCGVKSGTNLYLQRFARRCPDRFRTTSSSICEEKQTQLQFTGEVPQTLTLYKERDGFKTSNLESKAALLNKHISFFINT